MGITNQRHNTKGKWIDGLVREHQGVVSRKNPLASGGGVTPFDPLTLSPTLWLKTDAANNTLSTTGYAGSGTVTQVGTAITGISTVFLSEVVVGDVLSGTLISGTVTVVTDNTHLTVNASNSGAGASYTITPQAGVNDMVVTATDQSVNGNSATQGTSVNRPRKIPSVQNGMPSFLANGLSQKLVTASISHGIGTGDFYSLVVFKALANSASFKTVWVNGAAPGFYSRTTSASTGVFFTSTSRAFVKTFTVGTTYIAEIYREAGTIKLRANGVLDANTFADAFNITNNTMTVFEDGGTAAPGQHLFEFLFCNALPSSTLRDGMLAYANSKWAVY